MEKVTSNETKQTKEDGKKRRSEREPGNDPEEIRARKRGDLSEAGQGYRGAPL